MKSSSLVNYDGADTVTSAIKSRRSLRAFLPQSVTAESVRNILQLAARAPSGVNMQPWQVYVVEGASRQRLCNSVCQAFDTEPGKHKCEEPYYPDKWFEPYLSRRRKVGWDLYGLLNIEKQDRQKMNGQHRRNFQFFDAPVGIIFTVHRDLATGSWLDYGMFLQNIMILAREQGLHTCAQAAWADYHQVIRTCLPLDDTEVVVCGMALGYADPAAVENSLITERAELDKFVQFFN